jgi:hypothetical protein
MKPRFMMVKRGNEGSRSPFMARLLIGIVTLRDTLYLWGLPLNEYQQSQDKFDRQYSCVLDAAQAARDAAIEIEQLVAGHAEAITSGRAVQFRHAQCDILETIDVPLRQAIGKLLDQGAIATKTGLQRILKDSLNLDIGFLFQAEPAFKRGVATLRSNGDVHLAGYLETVRSTWHSGLQSLRVEHEHHGWSLPKTVYSAASPGAVLPEFPQVRGLPVNAFAVKTANRLLVFIENMMVYGMTAQCRLPLVVSEVPPAKRDPMLPLRFRVTPAGLDSSSPWVISYSDDADFL